jgi:putative oxidoreductase
MMRAFVSGLPLLPWPAEVGLFALRFYVGLSLFLTTGTSKFSIRRLEINPEYLSMVTSVGLPVPMFFALLGALAETVGALLLMIGLGTRWAALALAITFFVAAFLYGRNTPLAFLTLPQLLFWLFVCFGVMGSGRISVDGFLRRRMQTRV